MSESVDRDSLFVDVLLPLAIPKAYTYSVPVELESTIQAGIRVEVPLRNKLYSGIILKIFRQKPDAKVRYIISLIDEHPIIEQKQIDFWQWLSEYYCAYLGEVMNVALPGGLKLSSETKLLINHDKNWQEEDLNDDEYLVAEALSIQNELTVALIQDILNKKTVYPVIKSLLLKQILLVKEELTFKFKEKKATYLKIADDYRDDVEAALQLTARSEKQSRALLSYYSLSKKLREVPKKSVCDMAGVDNSIVNTLIKKEIFTSYEKVISRIELDGETKENSSSPLSSQQKEVYDSIKMAFSEPRVVLLHGVTGSGKTRVFVELIREVLATGGQILYLLPEIALTSQMVSRLKSEIGDQLFVYHSQINDQERVEIWNAALYKNNLFVGARSSLLLPFYNLRLIIVDEEHDSSYKQESPSPRYQGRDAAVKLATLYGANVILGSATPSLESYHNCILGKYQYVPMMDRYGLAEMPDIRIINLKEAYKKGLVKEGFTAELISEIEAVVSRKEQVILFQNRRGYSPTLRCRMCAWTAQCSNCDVSLTYHQKINELKCHYCGFRTKKTNHCPECGSHEIELMGSGTEKVEDIISQLMPEVRVERFDYDTTRSKKNQFQILEDFKEGRIDILVGTQMITKGFDFDNIALVGVLNADSLLSYPDFRASERGFQLLMQVGGRAGRRQRRGKVFIQAFHTDHPVLFEVLNGDYSRFYGRELSEREKFSYPPFVRLITVWFRHRELKKTKEAAHFYYKYLVPKFGARITGPLDPSIIRVRGQYQQVINIKYEKSERITSEIKKKVREAFYETKSHKDYKSVTIQIDVDPY